MEYVSAYARKPGLSDLSLTTKQRHWIPAAGLFHFYFISALIDWVGKNFVVPANNHRGCAGRESSVFLRKVTGSPPGVALVAIRGDDECLIFSHSFLKLMIEKRNNTSNSIRVSLAVARLADHRRPQDFI